MLSRHPVFLCITTLVVVCSCLTLWAAKDFVAPRPENANTYASKDAHPNEHVTAAVDVYNSPPKDDIFATHYSEESILPVLLIITNDGDQPITVNSMRAQLVTASRSKLEAMDIDDVFRRVAHIKGNSNPHSVGPITLGGGNKNKKAQQQLQEITNARFAAAAVEPHTTKSGFLFFDVQGISQPIAGAHIYLMGVRDSGGSELMYFEIPLSANAADGCSGKPGASVTLEVLRSSACGSRLSEARTNSAEDP